MLEFLSHCRGWMHGAVLFAWLPVLRGRQGGGEQTGVNGARLALKWTLTEKKERIVIFLMEKY